MPKAQNLSKALPKIKPAKRPMPLVFRLVLCVVLILIGGAALRYSEDKHLIEAIKERISDNQKMQEVLGWGSELKIDKKTDPTARIRFMLRDKNHEPIKGALVKLTLSHSSERNGILGQNSITIPLTMVEPGVYRAQASIPVPGDWDAAISAQIGSNTYQVNQRITLP